MTDELIGHHTGTAGRSCGNPGTEIVAGAVGEHVQCSVDVLRDAKT